MRSLSRSLGQVGIAASLAVGMSLAGAPAWGNPITAFEENPSFSPFPPGGASSQTGDAQATFLGGLVSPVILSFTGFSEGRVFEAANPSWNVPGFGTFSVDPSSDAFGEVLSFAGGGSTFGGFGTTSVDEEDPFLWTSSHGDGGTGSEIPPYMFEFTFDAVLGPINSIGFFVVDAGDLNERLIVELFKIGEQDPFETITVFHEIGANANASIFFWGYTASESFSSFRVLTEGLGDTRVEDFFAFDDFIFGQSLEAVPAPGTLLLFGSGLLAFAAMGRRGRRLRPEPRC